MNGALDDSRRRPVPARSIIAVQIIKNRVENWAGAGDPGNFAHRRAIEIAGPNADGKFGREPDRPVIAEVGARARFAGDRVIETQGGIHAERQGARGIVAQNIGNLPD